MRLLNTGTLQLSYFVDSKVPPYAILSHTWGEEEVLFSDICEGTTRNKSGFVKLEGCCKKATADGFEWVWIDTCCIDKSSSAELSEAINSMYQWYKASVICYVYLEDISLVENNAKFKTSPLVYFAQSRWFTRGWTLQELIAPPILEFYTAEWVEMGTKASLSGQISDVTGIPIPILRGEDPSTCTVAYRMSWASKRQTTREEDIAYCLLGIFGVNMPMLYGEGSKAFQRLQEEIMKQNEDYTLFAWSLHYDCSPLLTGVLASSPADFSEFAPINLQSPMLHYHSKELSKIIDLEWITQSFESQREANNKTIERLVQRIAENPIPSLPYEISYKKRYDRLTYVNWIGNLPASLFVTQDPPQQTSRGIRINMPVKLSEDPSIPSMAWTYCLLEGRPVCIFIDKPKSSENLFARQRSSWLVTITPDQLQEFQVAEIYIHSAGVIRASDAHAAEPEQVWGRIKMVHEDCHEDCTAAPLSVYPSKLWNLDELFYNGQQKLYGAILFECIFEKNTFNFAVVIGQHKGAPWCEVFSRDSTPENKDGFINTKFLQGLVAEASQRESFVNSSDRSTITIRNQVVFSAALRQRPSPDSMATVYTLRTSFCSFNVRDQWKREFWGSGKSSTSLP